MVRDAGEEAAHAGIPLRRVRAARAEPRRVRHHSWMPTKTVMLKMVEAFGTGEVARVDQFISPDYVDHQGFGEGEVRGASGFAKVVHVARRAVAGLEVRIEDVITEDDRVAARINWQGVSADGRMLERETIDIIRVVEDKAVEHWGAETWSRHSDPSR
jgi:predicted ester cyclase